MPEPVFHLQDVVYSYEGGVTALNKMSLAVAAGTHVALLGANGSGKSTLLRVLDGLCFPQGGTVTAFGAPLTEESLRDDAFACAFRRRVGLVFQNPDVQLFSMSVFDELAFGPLQLGWPKDEIRRRVAETLETFGIAHLKDRPPHRLSGGEKKRVALASVLVLDPEVVLLDEPTAGLDLTSEGQMLDILAGWKAGAKTVVTATHDLATVEEIADHCLVLCQGTIAAEGPPAAILNDKELLVKTGLTYAR
ncbi:MAG TPA: ABC transporter ATP-binding protein [Gemmataceae bacterium]|nr:ABC transporter ATP-binding protein [Gemmataceae bacterium]